jgi:hypothetical protein
VESNALNLMLLDIEFSVSVAQRFLLSPAARTLSLASVARMSDAEARATFQRIRWADNGGEPYCPRCGCLKAKAHAPGLEMRRMHLSVFGDGRDDLRRPQAPPATTS